MTADKYELSTEFEYNVEHWVSTEIAYLLAFSNVSISDLAWIRKKHFFCPNTGIWIFAEKQHPVYGTKIVRFRAVNK